MNETIQLYSSVKIEEVKRWYPACLVSEFPTDGGLCIEYNDLQIAVFNFSRRDEWYATQNLCPHKHQMILSRGIPILSESICFTAGYNKMNFKVYTFLNIVGAIPISLVYGYFG